MGSCIAYAPHPPKKEPADPCSWGGGWEGGGGDRSSPDLETQCGKEVCKGDISASYIPEAGRPGGCMKSTVS